MALDPNNLISYSVWLSQPATTRHKIAALFNIPRNGVGEVVDNRQVQDGFLHKDLAVISKDAMREATGVDSDDFYVLFNALVEVVEGRKITQEQTNVQQEEPKSEEGPVATKKRGRPAKGTV